MKKVKEYTAALGEHTGHSHKFSLVDQTSWMKLWNEVENAVAEVAFEGDAILSHEEHKEILFIKGNKYKQYQMREIDPFTSEVRQVLD